MKWETYKLKQLCSEIVDCVNKTAPTSDVPTPYKMLRTSDIREGKINLENLNCVTKEVYEKWTRRGKLQKGDVIFTREAPLGEVGLVREEKNYFLGQRLVLFRANNKMCDGRFLMYSLLWHDNKQAIISKGVGSTVAHLRVPECENIEIKAPDLDIQHRIADSLSAYDDLIENNQKQIKLLEEAAQRLYKEWFVDLRFPGYENTKIVDGVPEGWSKSTVGNICKLRKVVITPDKIESNTPYIGLEHMPRNDICLSMWGKSEEINSNKFIYLKKDVLFGKIRPYFHKVGFALNDGITSTDTMVMVADQNLWGLLLVTVSSDAFVDFSYQNCKEGAKMPRADWKQMEKYAIMIADQATQKLFEQEILVITNRISALAFQCRSLREARDRMLPKLMGGEVEV